MSSSDKLDPDMKLRELVLGFYRSRSTIWVSDLLKEYFQDDYGILTNWIFDNIISYHLRDLQNDLEL